MIERVRTFAYVNGTSHSFLVKTLCNTHFRTPRTSYLVVICQWQRGGKRTGKRSSHSMATVCRHLRSTPTAEPSNTCMTRDTTMDCSPSDPLNIGLWLLKGKSPLSLCLIVSSTITQAPGEWREDNVRYNNESFSLK